MPVVELRLQRLALKPRALPHGEVRVLHGQLGERRRLPTDKGRIERGELTNEQFHRPRIRNDVMHRQDDDVILRAKPQHTSAQQRPLSQIERAAHFGARTEQGFCFAFRLKQRAQIINRQHQRICAQDDLRGRPALVLKDRAQDFVPPDHFLEAARQRREVKLALESHRRRHVVSWTARLQLIKEPQPLLRKRQRQRTLTARRSRNRWPRCVCACLLLTRLDHRRELRHRRRIEQRAQRHPTTPHLAHPRDDLCRQQRVPAQLEEVVVDAHHRHTQHCRPDAHQQLLNRRARRRISSVRGGSRLRPGGRARQSTLPLALSGKCVSGTKVAGSM